MTGGLSPDARKRGVGGKYECLGRWPRRRGLVLRFIGGQRLHRPGRGLSLLVCRRVAIEFLLDAAALSSRAPLCLLDAVLSRDHWVRLGPVAAQCFWGFIAPPSAAFEPLPTAPSRRVVWRPRAHRERGGRRREAALGEGRKPAAEGRRPIVIVPESRIQILQGGPERSVGFGKEHFTLQGRRFTTVAAPSSLIRYSFRWSRIPS